MIKHRLSPADKKRARELKVAIESEEKAMSRGPITEEKKAAVERLQVLCLCMYVCMYVCISVFVCVCLCVWIYVYMCVCLCLSVYTCVCIHDLGIYDVCTCFPSLKGAGH